MQPRTDVNFTAFHTHLRQAIAARSGGDNDVTVLPSDTALASLIESLPNPEDPEYLSARGIEATLTHILNVVIPSLNCQGLSSRYYGFVTGGTLPVAEAADNVVTALDQNVQVHLPDHSASTAIEDAALKMLLALFDLGEPHNWPGRTFTTGATASNVIGLACGREAVITRRLREIDSDAPSVAELGLLAACQAAGVKEIQILTSMGHSSLTKAASVVGLGHRAVKELRSGDEKPWRLDLDAVERELSREGVARIIVVSAGEVNTGQFATATFDLPKLRSLADRYGAWIHVDGGRLSQASTYFQHNFVG